MAAVDIDENIIEKELLRNIINISGFKLDLLLQDNIKNSTNEIGIVLWQWRWR